MLTVVDRDAHPLAWREAGRGPLALFLHGLGGSRASWDLQLVQLGVHRRCVAWDMPGYGRSAGLPTSLDDVADAAAELVQSLGESRADVIGLSLGGMVAQHLALRHPSTVRSLALLDTSPAFGLDATTTAAQWLADRLAPLDAGTTVAELAEVAIPAVAGRRCPPDRLQEAVRAMHRVPADAFRAACHALVRHDVRDRLHAIAAPCAVLVGQDDTETPVEYARTLAAGIPGATLDVVPGAGHLLNIEAPEAVSRRLTELWGRAEEDAA
jgi:pimeloyl-ACP methyl ester carboxylesterase